MVCAPGSATSMRVVAEGVLLDDRLHLVPPRVGRRRVPVGDARALQRALRAAAGVHHRLLHAADHRGELHPRLLVAGPAQGVEEGAGVVAEHRGHAGGRQVVARPPGRRCRCSRWRRPWRAGRAPACVPAAVSPWSRKIGNWSPVIESGRTRVTRLQVCASCRPLPASSAGSPPLIGIGHQALVLVLGDAVAADVRDVVGLQRGDEAAALLAVGADHRHRASRRPPAARRR